MLVITIKAIYYLEGKLILKLTKSLKKYFPHVNDIYLKFFLYPNYS